MLMPYVFTRMKQPDEYIFILQNSTYIGPFATVTKRTGIGQIFAHR